MATSAPYAAATYLLVFSISRSVTLTDRSGGVPFFGTSPLAPAIGMASTAAANQTLSLFMFLPSRFISTPGGFQRLLSGQRIGTPDSPNPSARISKPDPEGGFLELGAGN